MMLIISVMRVNLMFGLLLQFEFVLLYWRLEDDKSCFSIMDMFEFLLYLKDY